jgi:hypothetical protein
MDRRSISGAERLDLGALESRTFVNAHATPSDKKVQDHILSYRFAAHDAIGRKSPWFP